MKFFLTLILSLCCLFGMSAQILKKEMMLIIKRDNITALKADILLGQENSCLDQKGAKFSLLGLSIRFKAKQCFNYLIA